MSTFRNHNSICLKGDAYLYGFHLCFRFMLTLYLYAVQHLEINTITHKYLIRGHTQNEGDAIHSIIEKSLTRAKKSGPVYVPDQYVTLIRNAKKKGKPLQVKEMGYEDFIDTKILFNKMAPNMSKDFCGDDFKLSAVKMLRFQKGSNFFFFKYSYKQTEWSQVEFKPKKRRSII